MRPKTIDVNKLHVDETYQRTVQRSHVKRIVDSFDMEAFGRLLVASRGQQYYVVDGWHRLAAAKLVGKTSVPCDVFTSRGKSHEAEMFRKANARRQLDARIVFRCRLVEGDPVAQNIESICNEHGFHTWKNGAKRSSWPMIAAVRELDKAFEDIGGKGLSTVLHVIASAYTHRTEGVLESFMIGGLTAFLKAWPDVDVSRLIQKLKKVQPYDFLRAAAGGKGLLGGGRNKLVSLAIMEVYNKGLKTGRLSHD